MKKLSFLLVSMGITLVTYAQPVADNATIPISVTLNSILRLNVTAGGNIEFAVNTLSQYQNGVSASALTTTKFTVASSTDFNVNMYSETANLIGTSVAAGTNIMLVDNIGYYITEDGTANAAVAAGVGVDLVIPALDLTSTVQAFLTSGSTLIIDGQAGMSAGDIAKNSFSIHWELATQAVDDAGGRSLGTLLAQNLDADRYTANVFLVLSAK